MVAGTTITASWGNANVRDQTIVPFASASARSSAITAPIAGMVTHRSDSGSTGDLEWYDGTAWRPLRRKPAAVADRAADQTITNNTNTYVSFTTETIDNASMFAPTSDTITIQEAGVYLVVAGGVWASNATGIRLITIRQNGSDVSGGYQLVPGSSGGSGYMHATAVVLGAVSDTIRMNVLQTSGGDLVIGGNRLAVVRISGA